MYLHEVVGQQNQKVHVITSSNQEDTLYSIYSAADLKELNILTDEGCVSPEVEAVTPLAEPASLLELFQTIQDNDWVVVAADEAIWY